MNALIWMSSVAVAALAAPVVAQEATPQSATQVPVPLGPTSQAPAVDAVQQGVLVFEPAFFADSRPNTALDMIERLPGFGLYRGDSGTRGFAGAAGNVLIDGDRPSSKSDGLDQILSRISAASVERIELIRGGAPGIDMQGRAVVANVVLTRQATVERVLEGNAYLYRDGYVGPVIAGQVSRRAGDSQLEASLRATTDRTDGTSTGFRRRYEADGALTQDAELDLWNRIRNVRGTGAWQGRVAQGKLRVNGLLSWFGEESAQDVLIRSGAGSDAFNDETSDSVNGELGVNWTRDFGPRHGLELIGLQRNSKQDYVGVSVGGGDTSTFSNASTTGETIARAVLRYRPSDRWSVETGAEAAYNFLDSANTFAENGVALPLPSAAVKVEELRGEAFGQATWRPSPSFTLDAGVRLEVSEIGQSGDSDLTKSFVYPKPRLQATWTPWAGHQIRLRLEREVGQLDFDDFVASADIALGQVEGGNPDLEPQKADVVEAVYERRFWGEGALEVTASRSEVEDVVDLIPLAGGFDGVGNIGDGVSDFLQIRLTLPLDQLGVANARLQARGSWAHTEVTDPVTGEERRFRGSQTFGCGVAFNHDLQDGRWSYGFDHGCNVDRSRSFRVREVRRQIAEPMVTLYGQWKPSADLTVRIDVGNATDRAQGYDREIYTGPRGGAPLLYRETRRTERDPWLFVQVRQSL